MDYEEMTLGLRGAFANPAWSSHKHPVLIWSARRFMILSKKLVPQKAIKICDIRPIDVQHGPDKYKWNQIMKISKRLMTEGKIK